MSQNAVEVLLVEDSPEDAEMTIRVLQKHNLANHLHHVKDGAEALDFLFAAGAYQERRVDDVPRLVLLDLMLPKVGGLEVLRRIKGDARTQKTPVVVMTSSREDKDVIESYRLGVNSYVVKPVEFDDFARAVAQLGLYWMLLNQPGS